jgi:hypothetical protein
MVPRLSRLRCFVRVGVAAILACLLPGARGAFADPEIPYAPLPPGPNDFHRGAPYTFRARGGPPRERLLGSARGDAWVAEDGATMGGR